MAVKRLVALLLASVVALGGCSLVEPERPQADISDLSTRRILNAAERRLKDVDSVTVKGTGRDGEHSASVNMAFAPESASGWVKADGVSFKVLNAKGKSYIKVGKAFYDTISALSAAQRKQVIRTVDGRWIDPGDEEAFVSMASAGLRNDFFDDFLIPNGKIQRQPEKKVKGVVCIALKDKDGTLYVDKRDGTPIFLTGKSTRLTFSYAPVAEFKPPRAAEVLTVAELEAALRR
jgi:hypothetical protein